MTRKPRARSTRKTKTIGYDDDNPSHSFLIGHVTATEFNQAFSNEGWSGGGWVSKSELKHGHMRRNKNGTYEVVAEGKNTFEATIMEW